MNPNDLHTIPVSGETYLWFLEGSARDWTQPFRDASGLTVPFVRAEFAARVPA